MNTQKPAEIWMEYFFGRHIGLHPSKLTHRKLERFAVWLLKPQNYRAFRREVRLVERFRRTPEGMRVASERERKK